MNYDFYTYDEGRRCKHCSSPLADQVHKNRHFCENKILEDGSVKSCHDDYHIQQRKQNEKPFREEAAFQKKMALALAALLSAFGPEVSLSQLNLYGIQLPNALEIKPKGDKLFIFRFTGFLIEQLTFSTFKLHPYVSAF